jgi:hypothetical protein
MKANSNQRLICGSWRPAWNYPPRILSRIAASAASYGISCSGLPADLAAARLLREAEGLANQGWSALTRMFSIALLRNKGVPITIIQGWKEQYFVCGACAPGRAALRKVVSVLQIPRRTFAKVFALKLSAMHALAKLLFRRSEPEIK